MAGPGICTLFLADNCASEVQPVGVVVLYRFVLIFDSLIFIVQVYKDQVI